MNKASKELTCELIADYMRDGDTKHAVMILEVNMEAYHREELLKLIEKKIKEK